MSKMEETSSFPFLRLSDSRQSRHCWVLLWAPEIASLQVDEPCTGFAGQSLLVQIRSLLLRTVHPRTVTSFL